MKLNYWQASWPLQSYCCPCDLHFIDYLNEAGVRDKVIFHFGSGEHHILGKTNLEAAVPNEILAITASRREHQTYIDFIIDNPLAAKTYKVLFGDIYTLTPRILPELDLVTLFHLCEFYDERTARYAELDDYSLVTLFVSKLNPGGKVLFYKGSSHFSRCREVVDTIAAEGRLVPVDDYKSLLVYGLP